MLLYVLPTLTLVDDARYINFEWSPTEVGLKYFCCCVYDVVTKEYLQRKHLQYIHYN